MYKLSFYVPASHLEQVKTALFEHGAGQFNGYQQCCWQILGEGQFKPLAGSQPFLGEIDKLEKVAEYKVEMICQPRLIKLVVQTLLKVHPYQEPAYEIYKFLLADDLEQLN